jgi:hypothetical protein
MTGSLSYKTRADADADRAAQLVLMNALSAWDRAFRRDECGAWRINGERGHIYTWGDGASWLLYLACRSSMAWTYAKKRLAFCKVTQNGDDEGCLRLFELPTAEQAEAIRELLAIRKRTEHSPGALERLLAGGKSTQFAKKQPSDGSELPQATARRSGEIFAGNPPLSETGA